MADSIFIQFKRRWGPHPIGAVVPYDPEHARGLFAQGIAVQVPAPGPVRSSPTAAVRYPGGERPPEAFNPPRLIRLTGPIPGQVGRFGMGEDLDGD